MNQDFASAIYTGSVVHTRLRPVRHRLRYRMILLLLDLDELPHLAAHLRFFSANRFNVFAFHDRDHLDGSDTPLRTQVNAHLARAGIDLEGGPIRLLCMPRILGTAFNPLSIYFCHAADGSLRAMLYEVNNTFGQRHTYLIPVNDPHQAVIRQRCTKQFYVSPFMEMAMHYHFRIVVPGRATTVAIEAHDADGPVLSAGLTGQRQDLTDHALLRGLLRHTLLAAKVIGGIHWEAWKLWRKGLRIRPRPAPPENAVSIVLPAGSA